jgi:hypothetical protein
MRHFLWALAGALALGAAAGQIFAAPRVEADPNKMYPITPEAGPYVVCAASWMGQYARELARQTVYELRRRDNLPAYFFDYSEEERRQLQGYLDERHQQHRRGTIRVQDQCGVLIGGFPDLDSARRAVDAIKKLNPPDLDLGPGISTQDMIPDVANRKWVKISPFAHAFATRNPTLQREAPFDKNKDPFLKQLNADEEYSLLKNPHPFTLAVKEYVGLSAIQSVSGSDSFLAKLWLPSKSADVLDAAGKQAHETARVLRKLGFEAYVLHTRQSSVVTVGSFDTQDDVRMQDVQTKLRLLIDRNKKSLGQDPMQLFDTAIPMPVARP